jgi:hypothetical protein
MAVNVVCFALKHPRRGRVRLSRDAFKCALLLMIVSLRLKTAVEL